MEKDVLRGHASLAVVQRNQTPTVRGDAVRSGEVAGHGVVPKVEATAHSHARIVTPTVVAGPIAIEAKINRDGEDVHVFRLTLEQCFSAVHANVEVSLLEPDVLQSNRRRHADRAFGILVEHEVAGDLPGDEHHVVLRVEMQIGGWIGCKHEDGSFDAEIQIIIASTIANGFNKLCARGY